VELQRYLTICRRWWWIVIAAVVVTVGATVVLLGTPTRMYESKASFVIQPQASEEGDQVRALGALVQGGTIGETYASIARSKLVRDRAAESLTEQQRKEHMTVTAEVVTGTRIVQLSVRSKHPADAKQFAAAVSRETVAYVDGLADNYRLDPLDAPSRAAKPLPTKRVVTLTLAGILGLMLGVALAFFADYLWRMRAISVEGATSSGRPSRRGRDEVLWTPAPLAPDGMSIAHAGAAPSSQWPPMAREQDLDSPA
jgi:capsular polysaccharide biosynthesis protein